MATLVLRTAGAAIGSVFGPVGSAVGGALGAIAGHALDQQLFGETVEREGPRLAGFQPQTAEEGVSLPQVFGTMRVGGSLIWMTRHEEDSDTERTGGKGGAPKTATTTYSYYANFALAICEGEIAGVRRVWMDGREIDLTEIEMRVYRGAADQEPDPLIEAKQGSGNTPAYRGTAYAVFERLSLANYGDRLPQVQFEVMRPLGGIAEDVRAVCLIPGSTAFGLNPSRLVSNGGGGNEMWLNRHILYGESDFSASVDELMALCPNLRNVALIVSWYGDDLRAGHCRIRPGVTGPTVGAKTMAWSVAGETPATAHRISTVDGKPAFGSTPADETVIAAIADLRARGLAVTLYPFVLMDAPSGNGLPDPYGGEEQAAYPWRGRIVPMGDAAAVDQEIAGFLGNATGSTVIAGGPGYAGSTNDAGYRRFILHCADLAVQAGGIDAFLIGSELCGLTTARNSADAFPFVAGLRQLAGDVRAVLGADTGITYGADWSEWFGYHPADGSGDIFFHLDPLWSDANIDAIGIDNYLPLSDWRSEDVHSGNPDGAEGPWDEAALAAAIDGGEYHDWYYLNDDDRTDRQRTSIEDGAYGKDWVFRPKAIEEWWSNAHFERRGGVELADPTDWTPMQKPVWLTEIGAPAIDGGATQPNVFLDDKSTESAAPHASDGGRDDLVQRRFIRAHLSRWAGAGTVCVEPERLYLWAWDTRPFPVFPLLDSVWSDGGAWVRGHWLNGRLDQIELGDCLAALLRQAGVDSFDVSAVDAMAEGIVIDAGSSLRQLLAPVLDLHGIEAFERDGILVFRSKGRGGPIALVADPVERNEEGPAVETRASPGEAIGEVLAAAREPLMEYQSHVARQFDTGSGERPSSRIAFPGAMHRGALEARAADRLRRAQEERISLKLSLPPSLVMPQPATRFCLDDQPAVVWTIEEVETGLDVRLHARRDEPFAPSADRSSFPVGGMQDMVAAQGGAPAVAFLDLPASDGGEPADRFRIAAWSGFWTPLAVMAAPAGSFEQRALLDRAATMGVTVDGLSPAIPGRFLPSTLRVQLPAGALSSVERAALLAGANAAVVEGPSGWEVLQFQSAEEIAEDLWLLSDLLRGQLGTEDIAEDGLPIGARFVLLDTAVVAAGLLHAEIGLETGWRVEPAGRTAGTADRVETSETGGLRASMPLSPVHATAGRDADDLHFQWIRRGRVDADRWEGTDIPLGEDDESYQVTIRDAGDAILFQQTEGSSGCIVPWATFAAPDGEHELEVRQLSRTVGAGIAMRRTFVPSDISSTEERRLLP